MKTSAESINGKLCTIIHKPMDINWIKAQIDMHQTVLAVHEERGTKCLWNYVEHTSNITFITPYDGRHTANEFECMLVILPPLPRHPKPEDARLLFRYASEGLEINGLHRNDGEPVSWTGILYMIVHTMSIHNLVEITHALDPDGNRVEIAILEDTHAE